jgi:hypothetical protein
MVKLHPSVGAVNVLPYLLCLLWGKVRRKALEVYRVFGKNSIGFLIGKQDQLLIFLKNSKIKIFSLLDLCEYSR